MDAAFTEDVTRAFPFSAPGEHRLVKATETPRSATKNLDAKRAAAIEHAAALTWTGDTGDIKGAGVLLGYDVFTGGSQLPGCPSSPTADMARAAVWRGATDGPVVGTDARRHGVSPRVRVGGSSRGG